MVPGCIFHIDQKPKTMATVNDVGDVGVVEMQTPATRPRPPMMVRTRWFKRC
jgi:hypothetical protein